MAKISRSTVFPKSAWEWLTASLVTVVTMFCRRLTVTLQHGYSWLVASSPWQTLSSTMAYIDTWWDSQIYIYQVYTCEDLTSHTQDAIFNVASSLIMRIHTFLCAGRNDFSTKIRLCQYLQMVWPGKFMVTLSHVSCQSSDDYASYQEPLLHFYGTCNELNYIAS